MFINFSVNSVKQKLELKNFIPGYSCLIWAIAKGTVHQNNQLLRKFINEFQMRHLGYANEKILQSDLSRATFSDMHHSLIG